MKAKKSWVIPELIVLVRSNPEEAVLAGCKTMDEVWFEGPFNVENGGILLGCRVDNTTCERIIST